MSAFIKRQTARVVDLGTRPGLNGQVLISTGVAGIDRLLGGGLPLGSVLLIIEDSHSQQHLNLLKCFLAEGVCCKHSLALITGEDLNLVEVASFLPDQAKSSSSSTVNTQVRGATSQDTLLQLQHYSLRHAFVSSPHTCVVDAASTPEVRSQQGNMSKP
jgi:hypothetical protein